MRTYVGLMGIRHHRYHSAKTRWRNKNRGSYAGGVCGGGGDSDPPVGGIIAVVGILIALGSDKPAGFIFFIIIFYSTYRVFLFLTDSIVEKINKQETNQVTPLVESESTASVVDISVKNTPNNDSFVDVCIVNNKYSLRRKTVDKLNESINLGFNISSEKIYCRNCGEKIFLLDTKCSECNDSLVTNLMDKQIFDRICKYLKWKESK